MNKHVTDITDPSWTDPAAAVRFLQQLRADGPWNLSAINPNGRIVSETFTESEAAERWIGARAADSMNIHYTGNPATKPTGKGGRAIKADIDRIEFVFADVDLDKIEDDSFLASLTLEERKERVLPRLKNIIRPGAPTHIIDSGGGFQILYQLDPPLEVTPENIELAERINAGLAEKIPGGDGSVCDIGHLLRLPFTANIPNATKRARGRVPCPATLVASTGEVYEADEFPLGRRRKKPEPVEVEFDAAEEVDDLDALAAQYGLDAETVVIVRDGRLKKSKTGDDSNSAWTFDCILRLLRHRVPHAVVKGLLLDPDYGISKHVLSARHTPEDQEAYAERQIRNALGAIKAEQDEPAFHEPVDLGGHEAPEQSTEARGTEDDEHEGKSKHEARRSIQFTPYVRRDPASIPPRDWVMKPTYIRKFTTGTLAHGAVGKSRLLMAEAVMLASGLPLLGVQPREQFRVVYWNGEDPEDELIRSVEAVCKHYDLAPEATDGFMMIDSGRNLPINIATQDRTGARIAWPEVDALVEALVRDKVDVLTIDPFVSCHSVQENDNAAVEKVAQAWNLVADRANVAIHIAHHAVKARDRDVGAMDYRGGGAALAKLRYLRTLNRMGPKEAANLGMSPLEGRLHIRIDDGEKSNLIAPSAEQTWFKLESVDLQNADLRRDGIHAESDKVGVVTPWAYPSFDLFPTDDDIRAIFEKMAKEPWRKTSASKDRWVGIPIAEVLGADLNEEAQRKRIRAQIDAWVRSGVLVESKPQGSDANGNKREGYVPGKLPEDDEDDDD